MQVPVLVALHVLTIVAYCSVCTAERDWRLVWFAGDAAATVKYSEPISLSHSAQRQPVIECELAVYACSKIMHYCL